MTGFEPPPWAAQPSRTISLEVYEGDKHTETLRVDEKPFYVFGRDATLCDVTHQHDSVSRMHAAIVHHKDGRCFIIDLKSTRGTKLNGANLLGHKPTVLKNKMRIELSHSDVTYEVHCDSNDEPPQERVTASHLLVKHRNSRRPKSWKDPEITRSEEEALAKIQEYQRRLQAGEVEFATLASTESDCSSARRGGDLGEFGPGDMQAAFEKATYALKVGELSQPVLTDSGVHLILRTG
ncbi:hypothetical protein BSKO_08668 [Bryopsis sp. KO-2023]|nr:hypothetical protein BSKO_08668 [Bryopsis sp. KO-2023]